MDNYTKKRYSVTVAGVSLNILTEESEDFVRKTADELSAEIRMITNHVFNASKLDAAILCALDAKGEAAKAESRLAELQAKLDVMELDAQNMRVELDALRDRCAPSKPNENLKSIESFLERKVNG